MTYREETMHLFEHFEDTCLCREIGKHEADRMAANEELMRPAARLQYMQVRFLASIAESLETLAAKPPN
jgi:hypothetical protein